MTTRYVLAPATISRAGDTCQVTRDGKIFSYLAWHTPITFVACVWDSSDDIMYLEDDTGNLHFTARAWLSPGFSISIGAGG